MMKYIHFTSLAIYTASAFQRTRNNLQGEKNAKCGIYMLWGNGDKQITTFK